MGSNNWYAVKPHVWGMTTRDDASTQDSAAADWVKAQLGKPYSYNYNMGTRSSFYCSQLVWASFRDTNGIDLNTSSYDVDYLGLRHPPDGAALVGQQQHQVSTFITVVTRSPAGRPGPRSRPSPAGRSRVFVPCERKSGIDEDLVGLALAVCALVTGARRQAPTLVSVGAGAAMRGLPCRRLVGEAGAQWLAAVGQARRPRQPDRHPKGISRRGAVNGNIVGGHAYFLSQETRAMARPISSILHGRLPSQARAVGQGRRAAGHDDGRVALLYDQYTELRQCDPALRWERCAEVRTDRRPRGVTALVLGDGVLYAFASRFHDTVTAATPCSRSTPTPTRGAGTAYAPEGGGLPVDVGGSSRRAA